MYYDVTLICRVGRLKLESARGTPATTPPKARFCSSVRCFSVVSRMVGTFRHASALRLYDYVGVSVLSSGLSNRIIFDSVSVLSERPGPATAPRACVQRCCTCNVLDS